MHRLNTSCGKPEGTVARYAAKLRGYMSQADLSGVITAHCPNGRFGNLLFADDQVTMPRRAVFLN